MKGTPDNPYKVTFTVMGQKYSGTGLTLQAAKHEAASGYVFNRNIAAIINYRNQSFYTNFISVQSPVLK